MQLNVLANWAAEQQGEEVTFVQLQSTPKWQTFSSSLAASDKKPECIQVVHSPHATLQVVVDALLHNAKVNPQHAELSLSFVPSSSSTVFLVLKRWDDGEAFTVAAEKSMTGVNVHICLPENEYSNVKLAVMKQPYMIGTRLIPQLLRNTKGNAALAEKCCEWLISMFYVEPYSTPESAIPRMMKSVLNITSALSEKGQAAVSVSVLRWTLEQNERRFPGVHRAVRSALLQDLANSLTAPQEQIPCYKESIALDLLDLREDPQTHAQFLIKRIVNNTRLVADLFHAEQDFQGELDTIHDLCAFYPEWPSCSAYQIEFTQDLRRCALLCQILLARMRKQRNPKRLHLIKKASAPPPPEEREILLRGVQVLEKILQVNREPPTNALFFRDFRTDFVQLAKMYTELEDYAQAERIYEEIFAYMQRLGYPEDCGLLVSFADVLKKRNSFHLSAMYVNRALEVQTLQNGNSLLCQENVNHLTRLELVHESARFNLSMLVGHLEEHIAHITNVLLAQAYESTGSGNDITTKLKEDFPDSASESDESVHNEQQQLENIHEDLARFTHPPHEAWAAQAGIEMLHCSSDDKELQFYITALNHARVLMAFAECMRDDAQRQAISLSKTLYHRAMQENRLNLLQPKFLRAVEEMDHEAIVDLASDVAVMCRQLGRGDQALFARNANIKSRIATAAVIDAALVNEIDEVAIEYFTFGFVTEAIRVFDMVVQYSSQLGMESLRVKTICNKAKALECLNTKDALQEATELYLLCNDLFPRQSSERLLVLRALFDCLAKQAATAQAEEVLDRLQVCAKQILQLIPRAEAVPLLIRLCQILLACDNIEDAEAFCHEASALAEPDSMNMYHVMEMRIAICRHYDDWNQIERHCQEALRILKRLVHNERDIFHFYGTVQIPLWLEHAEMLQFGTPSAVDLLNLVVHFCDLAIQFTRRSNDSIFAIRFCEHRGDAFFQLEAFDKAYASYQLGYLYSGEENTVLADKMDRVRDAMEDPATTDSLADCNSGLECYDEDEESGSLRTDEYYYGDEDEESSLGGGSVKEEVEEALVPRLEALHVSEEEEELSKSFPRQAEKRPWSNV